MKSPFYSLESFLEYVEDEITFKNTIDKRVDTYGNICRQMTPTILNGVNNNDNRLNNHCYYRTMKFIATDLMSRTVKK